MDLMNRIRFDDIDILFQVGNYSVSLINISYDPPHYPWTLEAHSHNTYEIHFVPKGQGILLHNSNEYAIRENTFYITGPDIMHKQQSIKENPMIEYGINLDFRYSSKNYEATNVEMNQIVDIIISNKFYLGDDDFGGADICREILDEIEHKIIGCHAYIEVLIRQLIINISRNITHNKINSDILHIKKNISKKRKRILDDFFWRYREKITIELAAKELFITKRQLSRIMQDYYGMSFTQKINRLRIDCAKEKLLSSAMLIEEIALYVGYSTEQYFCKIFKQLEHCTPSQYRKKKSEI